MSDLPLFAWTPPVPFTAHGSTFTADRDSARLGKQCLSVYNATKDGNWHVLSELHDLTGYPEASISARLRQLRNDFGFTIERRFLCRGLHEYRMVQG